MLEATYQVSRLSLNWFCRKRFLKVLTIYGYGGHLGHVINPSCINIFFHCSQNLSRDIWSQITQQFFRKKKKKKKKKRFKIENGTTYGEGKIMTLTFDIHVASLDHLVQCNFEIIGCNSLNNFHFFHRNAYGTNLDLGVKYLKVKLGS